MRRSVSNRKVLMRQVSPLLRRSFTTRSTQLLRIGVRDKVYCQISVCRQFPQRKWLRSTFCLGPSIYLCPMKYRVKIGMGKVEIGFRSCYLAGTRSIHRTMKNSDLGYCLYFWKKVIVWCLGVCTFIIAIAILCADTILMANTNPHELKKTNSEPRGESWVILCRR